MNSFRPLTGSKVSELEEKAVNTVYKCFRPLTGSKVSEQDC